MYTITSKLNPAFATIGKAMADKMTAKVVGKSSSFRFSVKKEHAVMQRSTSGKI